MWQESHVSAASIAKTGGNPHLCPAMIEDNLSLR